ncbi:MAG: phosphoesterase, partial [Richelia sp. RM2_1_2]|nr:phosphoesterase [Richelia sp. SL_2_1]NJO63070.1 phosphoesterase [Richelia sp. RM2_1_2]
MDFSLHTEDPVLLWNQATLEAISNTNMGPTPTSRALGLVNTSMYDAWAAYDSVAIGTQLGNLQVDSEEITPENKSTAINYAAYTTLLDLFPTQEPAFTQILQQLGIDSTISSTNIAAGIGNLAAKTLLNNKYTDGSNQLNNYTDTTNYQPVNTWDKITDPNRWQPISIDNGNNIQKFLTPQWGDVTP